MRSAMLVVHTGREDIRDLARHVINRLNEAGFEVRINTAEEAELAKDLTDGAELGNVTIVDGPDCAFGTEVALVLGGDGTFLRAAENARRCNVPLLGVNLGHVGFLAETELDALDATVSAIVDKRYTVEERMTLAVTASYDGTHIARDWALNEVSVEKGTREKMLEVEVSVDERPLLRFGCDGVICATPTGSTAYAFSVGGPIVWPDVEAMLVVPNAAHALFDRPLVVAPGSVIDLDLLRPDQSGILSCDGRRIYDLPAGSRLRIERGTTPILVARPHRTPFGERLVEKFQLPVRSFRDGGPSTV
ncbi:NAD kinase [Jatrophihabitans telluris]|uniref:NAD kinase n=1 Tax=Jatrophihabitans telluris TaxID=2038343 RepID=A0ABY4R307_9ACTN|nr:NAD kinase [Jatrophihabitans telluris]UQX90115.1 NAD kinase [Jatrophihabitans telluris]